MARRKPLPCSAVSSFTPRYFTLRGGGIAVRFDVSDRHLRIAGQPREAGLAQASLPPRPSESGGERLCLKTSAPSLASNTPTARTATVRERAYSALFPLP